MRKKLIILIIIFILTLSILIIMKFSTTKISNVVNIDLDEVTKISFRNGGNGELVETDDKNKIKEFTSYLKELVLKEKNAKGYVGYSYYADFYINDKKVMRITFARLLDINGTDYKVIYNKKDENYVNRFVEKLK